MLGKNVVGPNVSRLQFFHHFFRGVLLAMLGVILVMLGVLLALGSGKNCSRAQRVPTTVFSIIFFRGCC